MSEQPEENNVEEELSPIEKARKILISRGLIEPTPEPIEESEPEPIDPLSLAKEQYLKYKIHVLNKIDKQIEEENELSDYLAVPEWRELFSDYIQQIEFLINGYASSFTQTITINGDKLNFNHQFYDKNGKKIERVNQEVAVQSEVD